MDGFPITNPGISLTPVVTASASHTQVANELTIVNGATLQCSVTLPVITQVGQQAAVWWPQSIPATPLASGGSISAGAGNNIGGLSLIVVSSYLPYYSGAYYVALVAISLTEWVVSSAIGTDIASQLSDPRYGGLSLSGPFVTNGGFVRTATLLTNANYPYTTTTAESIILAGGTGTRSLVLTPPDIAAEYVIVNTSAAGYLQITGSTGPAGQSIANISGISPFNLGPGEGVHLALNGSNMIVLGTVGRGYGNVATTTGALQKVTANRTALPNENTLVTGASTITVTLPTVLTPNARNRVSNGGSGTVTVSPGTGTLTSLAAVTGNMTLAAGATAEYMNDGTNYFQVA